MSDPANSVLDCRYYFDGGGKLLRPCIAMCVGHLANSHQASQNQDIIRKQRDISMVTEMIHTASLVHDDILDHAETRRGKKSINTQWDTRGSTMAGDFILGVASRILAQVGEPDVVVTLRWVPSSPCSVLMLVLQSGPG